MMPVTQWSGKTLTNAGLTGAGKWMSEANPAKWMSRMSPASKMALGATAIGTGLSLAGGMFSGGGQSGIGAEGNGADGGQAPPMQGLKNVAPTPEFQPPIQPQPFTPQPYNQQAAGEPGLAATPKMPASGQANQEAA
jgi:hypothetical protein